MSQKQISSNAYYLYNMHTYSNVHTGIQLKYTQKDARYCYITFYIHFLRNNFIYMRTQCVNFALHDAEKYEKL